MCRPHFEEASSFMDKYRGQGDLADILRLMNRASSSDDVRRAAMSPEDCAGVDWQFPMRHGDCLPHGEGDCGCDFGDPFSNMKDPLFHEPELMTPNGLSFSVGSISEDSAIYPVEEKGGDLGGGHETFPCEIAFNCGPYVAPITSQSPQQDLSTLAMPFGSLENPMARSEAINLSSRVRLTDTATAMQISAVQKSSMKRRKGQAKKVVCIPATTSANCRSGGEVVPSDLWAWRKYGQKPIKGSPYPRGYYRCSSSKGCSARKQVERSCTDPNMLVITYTSEHNHPWPTQRNALAGSTRATQSANKNNSGNNAALKISSSSSPDKDQPPGDKRPNDVVSQGEAAAWGSSSAHIKEETDATNSEKLEEAGAMGSVPGKCNEDDDLLFRDLETMDGGGDPLSFLLNKGEKRKSCMAGWDSLGNFFDWSDRSNDD